MYLFEIKSLKVKQNYTDTIFKEERLAWLAWTAAQGGG